MIHHKAGQINKGADALSKRYLLLSVVESKVLEFEIIKGMYVEDEDFKELYSKSSSHPHGSFHIQERFLFKGTRLCIPKCGFRKLLIQELHGGALASHFGVKKTSFILKEHYYWPKISRDVEHFVKSVNLSNGQEPCTPPRPSLSFAHVFGSMERCELGFHYGTA